MSVVGVDFGCKNAVIAAAGRGGVDVLLNGNSNRQNPCMVGFDKSRSMGEAAGAKATMNYRNTIFNMKRLVGLAFDDPRAENEMKRVPFTCVPIKHAVGGPDSIGVKVTSNDEEVVIPVEAVAGMMVKHMGSIATAKTASSSADPSAQKMSTSDVNNPLFPQDWVITVPGWYTDSQKQALLTGCQIAGINGVQRLMHETTATALAYGIFKDIKKEFSKDKPTNVMFIDMGATSYSISIVEFVPGKLIVKSTHHDADLGGRDFDQLIAEWLAAKFEEKFKGKLSSKPLENKKVHLKLLAAAEKTKKTLSPAGVKEARVNLECLMDDLDFGISLKATEYEEMCQPLLARLNPPIQRAIAETKLNPKDLNSIEIVGGCTRIGSVKRTLAKILGLDVSAPNNGLSTTMNADEAIARGAALQSAILSPRFKVLPYDIVEYQPYPIKISWEGEAQDSQDAEEGESGDAPSNSVVMFDRGSNFPVVRRVTLRRAGEFSVGASYDESASKFQFPAGSSKEIATFKIKAPAGAEKKVRVNVKEDVHGTLLLSSAQMVEEIEEEVPIAEEEAKGDEAKKEGEEGKTEGEEGKKEGEEEKKVEKKKKIKKTNLEFSESRPLTWVKAELDKFFEQEVSMSNTDRIVKETADMRNELESYIYDMRDKIISESQLAPFATDDEKSAFSTKLESSENWLYEDGFDAVKSVYAEKLTELQQLGNPIVFRQVEANGRANAFSVLQRTVEKYQNWLNSAQGEEKYDHILYDEWQKCDDKCDEVSSWMYDMLDKQGSQAQSADPVVTVAQINTKSRELSEVVNPVMHKPRPKPKKEEKSEEKKPEEKKEGDQEQGEEKTEGTDKSDEAEPMDISDGKTSNPEPMDTQ